MKPLSYISVSSIVNNNKVSTCSYITILTYEYAIGNLTLRVDTDGDDQY